MESSEELKKVSIDIYDEPLAIKSALMIHKRKVNYIALEKSHEKVDCEVDFERLHWAWPGPNLKCDFCRLELESGLRLVAHRYTHTEDTGFTCLICFTTYHIKNELYRHMRNIHYNLYSYRCLICGIGFSNSADYKIHQFIHNKSLRNEDRPYECFGCPRRFKVKKDLDSHKGMHNTERLHKCNICFKKFVQRSYMTSHRNRVHFLKKRLACEYCDKRFK